MELVERVTLKEYRNLVAENARLKKEIETFEKQISLMRGMMENQNGSLDLELLFLLRCKKRGLHVEYVKELESGFICSYKKAIDEIAAFSVALKSMGYDSSIAVNIRNTKVMYHPMDKTFIFKSTSPDCILS